MGASSSTLKRNDSSFSVAYGRIRIDSPYSHGSPASRRQFRDLRAARAEPPVEIESAVSMQQRIPSWKDLRQSNTEGAPLLLESKTSTKGGAIELLQATSDTLPPEGESFAPKAPPLIVWIGPALLCALAYALYNIFIKKGSASIHPILGGVILQFVAAILGTLLLAFIVIQQHKAPDDSEGLYYDAESVRWAICAGISVGAAEILSFFVSSLGVQATQSIPTIIGGSVFFGCVLGAALLKEVLSLQGWLGVALICIGITLVGLDPAGVGAH